MQASRLGLWLAPLALTVACGGGKPEGSQIAAAEVAAPANAQASLLTLAEIGATEQKAAPAAKRPPVRTVQAAGAPGNNAAAAAKAKAAPTAPAEPAGPPLPAVVEDGAITLPDGYTGTPAATSLTAGKVQVQDFGIGNGAAVKKGDEIRVHYTGFTGKGVKFDSSVDRKKPFTFPFGAGRVIKGWDEGLAGMKVGGKRVLTIPPGMGYGARAAGKIPPNSTLVFAVELLEIVPPLPEPQDAKRFEATPLRTETTAGGTKIEVFMEGRGATANKGDTVAVHYTGTLNDGTEFDSSIPRKKPIEIPIGAGRVIKGWDEGIVGMRVGELRKLTIPAESGYGERQAGKIPPNSELTFTVELMRVTPAGK